MRNSNVLKEVKIDSAFKTELKKSREKINKQNPSGSDIKDAAEHLYRAIGLYVQDVARILAKDKILTLGDRIVAELPFSDENQKDQTSPNKKLDKRLKFWIKKLFLFEADQRKQINDFIDTNPYYDSNFDKENVDCNCLKMTEKSIEKY